MSPRITENGDRLGLGGKRMCSFGSFPRAEIIGSFLKDEMPCCIDWNGKKIPGTWTSVKGKYGLKSRAILIPKLLTINILFVICRMYLQDIFMCL